MKNIVVRESTENGPEVLINSEQITTAKPFAGHLIKIGFSDGKEMTVYCAWDQFKIILKAFDLTDQ